MTELNPGIEAVRVLAQMGYQFTVSGDTIKGLYKGQEEPDPVKVLPLMTLVKAHKDEVRSFMRCHCPRCGGVLFGTFADGKSCCMACFYEEQKKLSKKAD